MADNFQSRVSSIAYDLAKKDANYNEELDKENQGKLKEVLFISDMNRETIIMRVNGIINDLKRNPDFHVTKHTSEEILNVMEKHIQDGNLESINQIKDEEFITKSIVEPMVRDEKTYNKNINEMIENSYNNVAKMVLTASVIEQLMNGNLSEEKLNNLDRIFENSPEVIRNNINNMDKALNGTDEEKVKGATYISTKDVGRNTDYFKNNNTQRANRGSIVIILRKAIMGDKILQQDACLFAADCRMNNLINKDGTINFDKAYEIFRESIDGNERLMEKFSTKEKFISYIEAANQRCGKNKLHSISEETDFKEKWNSCKTDQQKAQLLKEQKQIKRQRIEALKKKQESPIKKRNEPDDLSL